MAKFLYKGKLYCVVRFLLKKRGSLTFNVMSVIILPIRAKIWSQTLIYPQ